MKNPDFSAANRLKIPQERRHHLSPAFVILVPQLDLDGFMNTTVQKPGNPDKKHISTSHVERQNLTMRMSMRRFTRLTNGFSKKVENLEHMVALHFMHYNFVRIHKSLHTTPAMAAGVSKKLWDISDIAALVPDPVPTKRGPYKKKNSN